jgi:DNA recombination protein RmuC
VAEAAGLIEGKDYEMQVSETTDAGIQRPDMVVKLPNNRCIIIDAKVSFSAYQEAVESEDPEFKRQKLQEHSQQVKKHIEGLANKKYQSLYAGTADFVVMFVPNEALYQVALQEDPKLIDTAMDKRVVLANPMTLIALLRTVASGIEQQKAYESALQIAQLGGELHDSISTFAGHFTKVGNAITSAANAYNEGLGSLERNVTSKARKLKSMGIKSAKELNEVNPLNANVRTSALSSSLEDNIS